MEFLKTSLTERRVALATFSLLAGLSILMAVPLYAQPATSNNYQIKEDYIGPGGGSGSSASYKLQDSLGAIGIGPAASPNQRTESGATTTDEPTLAFSVNASNVNFGALGTSFAKTGTATFNVLNYTSYGYIVQVIGSPPATGGNPLNGMTSAAPSAIGTEQFGINLKANTAPSTFGAEPVQQPDSSFGFGQAATGYNTANNYRYISGDTIASATRSSGETLYTISYLANISKETPGGSYAGSQTLVVTGTY